MDTHGDTWGHEGTHMGEGLYLGSADSASDPVNMSIVNFCSVFDPLKTRNPSNGMLEVPVTNCNIIMYNKYMSDMYMHV